MNNMTIIIEEGSVATFFGHETSHDLATGKLAVSVAGH